MRLVRIEVVTYKVLGDHPLRQNNYYTRRHGGWASVRRKAG